MARKLIMGAAAAAAMLLAVGATAAPALASTTQLLLPQGNAFAVLGHDCGGIGEQAFANGFDPTSGYPTGDVHLSTTCNGSGRGGRSTTYTAWAGATWDFTGVVVSYSALSTAPSVNPTFSAFDANGNEIYNQSNNAYLVLAPGYVPVPRLTSISVNQGPATGGTTVTITGTGFTGATAVSFGASAAASFTVSGDQTITAVSPAANGGTVDITVTTAGGTNALSASDQFTFVPAPVVSSLSPNSGPVAGGGYVTITGANLTYVTGVTFGDQATSFIVNSDTSISAYVPPSDSGVDSTSVSVSSIGGTSAGVQYDYVNVIPPAVTGAKPDVGPISGGQTVTITGSGFDPSTTVQFGSTPATSVTFVSSTKLTAVAPAGSAGTVDVTATGPGGTSSLSTRDLYAYGSPTLTSLSRSSGITGSSVTITGTGFAPGVVVTFGSLTAKATVVSGTQIKAVVPNGDAAPSTISVSDAQGSATSASQFTPTCAITGFSPSSGPPATVVTISGIGFTTTATVKFHGVPAASVTFVSSTTLQATVPATATTGSITVTNKLAPIGTVTSATSFTVG